MLNCCYFGRLSLGYVEDALSSSRRSAFARHLSVCESCREHVRLLQRTTAALRTAAPAAPAPNPLLWNQLEVRLRKQHPVQRQVSYPILAAGVTAAIACLGAYFFLPSETPAGPTDAVIPPVYHRVIAEHPHPSASKTVRVAALPSRPGTASPVLSPESSPWLPEGMSESGPEVGPAGSSDGEIAVTRVTPLHSPTRRRTLASPFGIDYAIDARRAHYAAPFIISHRRVWHAAFQPDATSPRPRNDAGGAGTAVPGAGLTLTSATPPVFVADQASPSVLRLASSVMAAGDRIQGSRAGARYAVAARSTPPAPSTAPGSETEPDPGAAPELEGVVAPTTAPEAAAPAAPTARGETPLAGSAALNGTAGANRQWFFSEVQSTDRSGHPRATSRVWGQVAPGGAPVIVRNDWKEGDGG